MKWLAITSVAATVLAGCSGEVGSVASPSDSNASVAGSPVAVGAIGAGSGVGASSSAGTGAGGTASAGASSGSASSSGAAASPPALPSLADGGVTGIPCAVSQVLATRCQTCHSQPPVAPSPMALVTYADLVAPSLVDKTKTYAEESVLRMQNTVIPMPPRPAAPATAAEVALLQSWISGGYPAGFCGVGNAGDGGADAATVNNPYATPAICTSMIYWTGGNDPAMRPGEACIACHSRGEGPRFSLAGTVYASAHEPNDCNSMASDLAGATVVITDANKISYTLTPDRVGNFSSNASLALPYQAKVVKAGNERIMMTPQTVGDCNSCHTPAGANMAPGRILLP
jgi:hypothetical protein